MLLRFLNPDWLISINRITFQEYFWFLWFSEFLSNSNSISFSLPVSLLLVGALKRYCEMISNATEPGEKAEVLPLGRS